MSKCGKAANVNQLPTATNLTPAEQDKARTNVQK